MSLRNCEPTHCLSIINEILELCKHPSFPPGYPIVTRDSAGLCFCSCGSFAGPALLWGKAGNFDSFEAYRDVQDCVTGDRLYVSGLGLTAWFTQRLDLVATTSPRRLQAVLVDYEAPWSLWRVVVTPEHLFLVAGTLRRADLLTKDDLLTAPSGAPVRIRGVHVGDYVTSLHHIAASTEPPDSNLTGHLLCTGGIVCADYTVQLMARDDNFAASIGAVTAGSPDVPVLGSPEYVARFGPDCLAAPRAVIPDGGIEVAKYNAPDMPANTFIPAGIHSSDIPPEACS